MQLSFTLDLHYGKEYFVSYSIPYTASRLTRFIRGLKAKVPTKQSISAFLADQNSNNVEDVTTEKYTVKKLCSSESLMMVPLITLSDYS